jgi:deazaflavin-dependent oxidoreductase (nitroreductase family)
VAETFHRHRLRRIGDRLIRLVVRVGFSSGVAILGVRGRRSGRTYETPVQPVEHAGSTYLVAPYGEVAWVRNARAAGEVTLTRRRRTERFRIDEVGVDEAAPVLREYVGAVAIVRKFFDADKDAPVEEFAREADRHPVFRLLPPG